MILRNAKDTKRFVGLLNKSKRKEDECWIWQGNCRGEYKKHRTVPRGRFGVNGKSQYAHRISWEYANDTEIPQGEFVLHTCDNHLCINPLHLYTGDANNNNKDKIGKSYKQRKINEAIKRYKRGDKVNDICNAIGICRATIWRYAKQHNIVRRKCNEAITTISTE